MKNKNYKTCTNCSTKTEWSEKYDLFFCKPCNRWNEEIKDCGDVECVYCIEIRKGVPEKPIQ